MSSSSYTGVKRRRSRTVREYSSYVAKPETVGHMPAYHIGNSSYPFAFCTCFSKHMQNELVLFLCNVGGKWKIMLKSFVDIIQTEKCR